MRGCRPCVQLRDLASSFPGDRRLGAARCTMAARIWGTGSMFSRQTVTFTTEHSRQFVRQAVVAVRVPHYNVFVHSLLGNRMNERVCIYIYVYTHTTLICICTYIELVLITVPNWRH